MAISSKGTFCRPRRKRFLGRNFPNEILIFKSAYKNLRKHKNTQIITFKQHPNLLECTCMYASASNYQCSQGSHLNRRMVCIRSWHLPGNPKLVWLQICFIKEWGCVDLKYPMVLFGSEGSALTLPPFLLSLRIIMLCHCSSTVTTDHFFANTCK